MNLFCVSERRVQGNKYINISLYSFIYLIFAHKVYVYLHLYAFIFIYKCVYTCMYRNVHTIHIYIERDRQRQRQRWKRRGRETILKSELDSLGRVIQETD